MGEAQPRRQTEGVITGRKGDLIMDDISAIYQQRFSGQLKKRNGVWRVLCRYFERYIPENATVLEMACGYGEFINNLSISGNGRKIAADINVDSRKYLKPEIAFIQSSAESVTVASDSVDVVFVSNFFEHLPDADALVAVLRNISRMLNGKGKLLVLQPDIRLVGAAYWDFLDHKLPITVPRLVEAAQVVGLRPGSVIKRFLPYTMSGKMPVPPFLVDAYLKLMPMSGWFFGKQAFCVFEKGNGE